MTSMPLLGPGALTLVGYSMGGRIALHAALAGPCESSVWS